MAKIEGGTQVCVSAGLLIGQPANSVQVLVCKPSTQADHSEHCQLGVQVPLLGGGGGSSELTSATPLQSWSILSSKISIAPGWMLASLSLQSPFFVALIVL